MTDDTSTRRPLSASPALLLAGMVLVTVALRFGRLGEWGFDSDEIFMRKDSLIFRFTNPRPLLYFLNHHLIAPLIPLDEFGIRLLPALFGVLAVPVVYFVTRRLLGTRPALFAAFLVMLSPLLTIYSQFGRYWSLVFLLTAVYPYAIYLGIRDGNRRALALGIVTGILATLAHPVAVLLAGGPMIWMAYRYLRPHYLRQWWAQPMLRVGMIASVIVVVALLARFIPILQAWIEEHDSNPGSGQFLLRAPPRLLKPVVYILAYTEGLTVPLVLIGALGVYLLWRDGDRMLATFLASLVVFPIAFLCLIMFRTPVSTYYALPAAPVFFIGAGYFLDRLLQIDWKVRPRWLVPALVLILVLIPGTPTLVSQFLNGRRFDFKSVAQWLGPQLKPGDTIVSDQPVVLGHYFDGRPIGRLRYDTDMLVESIRAARAADPAGALWIVAPAPAHAFRTNLKQGGLARWIYDNCQLRNTVGRSRVDFRQQYLQVYRCPTVPSPVIETS